MCNGIYTFNGIFWRFQWEIDWINFGLNHMQNINFNSQGISVKNDWGVILINKRCCHSGLWIQVRILNFAKVIRMLLTRVNKLHTTYRLKLVSQSIRKNLFISYIVNYILFYTTEHNIMRIIWTQIKYIL